jgi:hypothetical protein
MSLKKKLIPVKFGYRARTGMSQTPVKTQLKTQIWAIDLRNPPFDSDHHECYVAFPKAPVRA